MINMKIPAPLSVGDKIAIAAPARKISQMELAPALDLFRSWGLEVVVPPDVFSSSHQMAGDDITRASVLQQLLDDDEIKAIICARGGYGTVRIIDRLDFSTFEKNPKWVVGYSDVTVLHSHIHQRCGVETLHATMPINISADAISRKYDATESMRRALFGEALDYVFPEVEEGRRGVAEGVMVGGNLSILYSLCGSGSSIDTDGKVLFIEDLDEYLYHIDRMMQNLKRNGMLKNLAGLVVGQMSDMHDNAVPFGKNAQEIVMDAVSEYDYPVCLNFPAGHNEMDNHALIMGRKVRLTVGEETRLQFL